MKIHGLLIWLLTCSQIVSSQVSDEFIEAKIDSAWQYSDYGQEIDQSLRIANELIAIGENQNSYKALINGYQLHGEYYFFTSPIEDGALWYKKALKLSKEHADWNEEAHSLASLGSVYQFMGEIDSAETYYDNALKIRQSHNDTDNIMFLLYRRAWLRNSVDQHVRALQDYMDGLQYAEESKDSSYMASFLMGVGIIHKKQKNYSQAEEVAAKSVHIAELFGDDYLTAATKGNLALIYKSTGRLPLAKRMFLEQLAFFEKENHDEGAMSCNINLAVICNRLNEYRQALTYAGRGMNLAKRFSRLEATSDASNELAIGHFNIGQADSALHYVNIALENARNGGALEKERDAERLLVDILASQGNSEKALQQYKNYSALNDSILQLDKSKAVLELQTLYETTKKEQEIEKLNNQAQIDKLKNRWLMGGIFGIFLLGTGIVNREVKRRKKARQLHVAELKLTELEKSRLQDQLEFKNKELVSHALHLAQKNEMLQQLKSDLETLKRKMPNNDAEIRELFLKLRFDEQIDSNWNQFTQSFTELNAAFFEALTSQFPDLSKSDLRLCALLKMNLGTKDIANILNISVDGVKKARYRLRKKMNLESTTGLESMILSIN